MSSGVYRLVAAYALIWSALAGLVGVLGLVAGVFLVPAEVMFPLLFVAALIGMIVATTVWSPPAGTTISAGVGRSAVIAVTTISAIVAFAGLVVVLGAAGPPLVVVLGVTSPAAMGWCARRLGHVPGRRHGSCALTTAELCRQWQDSYNTLRGATTAAARLRIVEARQRYLDELERRDPIGLNAWLVQNASAAGDPSRFLARDGEDAPPSDG